MYTKLQTETFNELDEISLCAGGDRSAGGIVTFIGKVREESNGRKILKMELSAYEPMAKTALKDLRKLIMGKYEISNLTVVHRIGTFSPSDKIVCIVASSRHRGEAFDACRSAIDELKKSVPIWKKEIAADGEFWVEKL